MAGCMPHPRVALVLPAVLLALACDSAPAEKGADKGADKGKADAKKAETAGKADAKKADAKKTADEDAAPKHGDVAGVVAKAQGGETKAADADTKAPDAPPAKDEKATAEAKADPSVTAPEPTSGRFSKGDPGDAGLSAAELVEYAIAQGDPARGTFGLTQAFEGDTALADPKQGKLEAVLHTTMGDITCELFEDGTPGTVANFVGLARGTRPTYDKEKDEWVKIPYYDGVLFHRVIKGFMIQTGDRSGSGTGSPGYMIADEFDKSLKHKRAGTLSMANRGPNTGSSQFFVTVRDTPHLDGLHTVFGQCDTETAIAISKVATDPRLGNRPYDNVKIERVEIRRTPKK